MQGRYSPHVPLDRDGQPRDAPYATPLSARGEPPLDPKDGRPARRHAEHQEEKRRETEKHTCILAILVAAHLYF